MKDFEKEVVIGYSDVDKNDKLKNDRFLEILANVSMAHSTEFLGLPVDYMEQRGTHWVLYAWKTMMKELPKESDKIYFTTFATVEKEIYCYRYYIIRDEKRNIIGYAFAHWIAIDIENRKLTKIPEDIRDVILSTDVSEELKKEAIEKINYKPLRKKRNVVFEFSYKFDVNYLELDKNEHVNNAVNDRWAMETIYRSDKDFLNKNTLKAFDVVYKKEKLEGGYIKAMLASEENKSYVEIVDEEDTLLTILEYTWK